jgi:CelD/BcsL family acetyltransferase involved in cellulose biosynthesis
VGDPLTDLLGPIGAPADARRAVAWLVAASDRLVAPGQAFVGAELPAEWVDALDAPWTSFATPAPTVEISARWADYLAAPGARRRRRIAAQTAAALEGGRVQIDEHDDREGVLDALPVLIQLHRLRFGEAQRTFDGARGEFFRRALGGLAAVGAARLRVLTVDGEPAAAILVLHGGGADWFYQSGRDRRFDQWSPGRTLFADTVRQAFERGCTAFHLLRGDEPYKSWWATRVDQLVTIRCP